MKRIYILLILSAFIINSGLSQDASHNYIRTRAMLHESDTSKYIETIQYYDGLGRPYVNVQKGITPNHANLMTLQEYDAAGREAKTWLPCVTVSDYVTPDAFKSSVADCYDGDARPYSESVYEDSPLNRIVQQYGPGHTWANHPVSTSYMTNTQTGELSCNLYYVTSIGELAQNGTYAKGKLYVTQSIDEVGHISYAFTDQRNRRLLDRQMRDSIAHDTYYVYDDFDNKRFVLSPAYQSQPDLDLYAYQYTYDKRDRCIEKKIPGCETIKYVYDYADHLIFTQDGVQREHSEWTFYLYDAFCRLTVKGIYKNANIPSVENMVVTCSKEKGIYDIAISENLGSSGYKTNLNLGSPIIHEINYYDNYSFLSLSGFSVGNNFHNPTVNATGYQTGRIVGLFNEPVSYLHSATYYDIKGHPVEVVSGNHLNGYDTTTTTYTFTGNPLVKTHVHSSIYASITEVNTYTYDHADRLTTITHKLNGNDPIILMSNTYDDMGRLHGRKCCNSSRTTTYSYNIRNWLTKIQGNPFSENLSYTLNGNISVMKWRSSGQKYSSYQCTYDEMSRLKRATYYFDGKPGSSVGVHNTPNYTVSYTYDKNGNIRSLMRYGTDRIEHSALLDNLKMTYNGNQLINVSDASNELFLSYGTSDFKDGHKGTGVEYYYDANGNLEQDYDKNISRIQYNSLNLPVALQFNNGNATHYIYSADGRKCRITHQTAVSNVIIPMGSILPLSADQVKSSIITDYCNNIIYENGALSRILTECGYITLDGNTPNYYYYQKDHLGNNRVVLRPHDYPIEEIDYYPFGGIFGAFNEYDNPNKRSQQPYKYANKELDEMHGLNWYDFGSRYLRTDVPGWTGVDPLCEKYYSISPYVYCFDNPLLFADNNGMWPSWGQVKDISQKAFSVAGSFVEGVTVAIIDNSTGGIIPKVRESGSYTNAKAFNMGQDVGDVISIIKGAAEVVNGVEQIVGGGIAAPETASLSLAVSVEGVTTTAHGSLMATSGTMKLFSKSGRVSSDNSNGQSADGNIEYKTPKKGSGKEKADDVPSWTKGYKPYKGENGKQFAKRVMEDVFGKDTKYKVGPSSNYNKIKKWGDRGFE